MKRALPGGLDPADFLRRHWQKSPLLVRGALPDFGGELTPRDLMALACDDRVESRLVLRRGARWQVRHGPFEPADFEHLPRRNWTLLVQGVNEHFAPGAELLARFAFVPYARLDDLMVSYAPDGGGVGPHFDSYDVFLVQGLGRRHWRVSTQSDLELVPDAPLRILRRFEPQHEWLLEPGDMLYLPPQCAHDGIAVGECMTWSVGFRAPSAQELAEQFLAWLPEHLRLEGMYADPGLRPQREPAAISDAMLQEVQRMLAAVRWGRREVEAFLGQYLSEPKPHVFFEPPRRPLSPQAFGHRILERGARLDLRSRMLLRGHSVFMNGFVHELPGGIPPALRRLANTRRLARGTALEQPALDLLREWYLAGFIAIGEEYPHG